MLAWGIRQSTRFHIACVPHLDVAVTNAQCWIAEEPYSWVLKITVSKAKVMDATRPMSRLNSSVDTQVTTHTNWGEQRESVITSGDYGEETTMMTFINSNKFILSPDQPCSSSTASQCQSTAWTYPSDLQRRSLQGPPETSARFIY